MILPIFRKNQGRGFIAERISEPACAFPHGGIGEGKDEHGSFLGFNCCAVSVTGVGGIGSRAVKSAEFCPVDHFSQPAVVGACNGHVYGWRFGAFDGPSAASVARSYSSRRHNLFKIWLFLFLFFAYFSPVATNCWWSWWWTCSRRSLTSRLSSLVFIHRLFSLCTRHRLFSLLSWCLLPNQTRRRDVRKNFLWLFGQGASRSLRSILP